jgi:hypothetical protein
MAGPSQDPKKVAEENALLKEQNKILEQRLKIQEEGYSMSTAYLESLKEALGIQTRLSQRESDTLDINKKLQKAIKDQSTELSSIAQKTKEIAKNEELTQKANLAIRGLQASISEERKKQVDKTTKAVQLQNSLTKEIEEELKKLEKGLAIDQDLVLSKKAQLAAVESEVERRTELLNPLEKQLLYTKLVSEELQKQTKEREKEKKLLEEVDEKLGVAGKLSTLIGKIPGLGTASAKALEKVTKEMKEAADKGEKLPSKLQTLGMIAKETSKSLITGLKDPLVIVGGLVTALVKTFKDVDKGAEDTARGMNMSYTDAVKFRTELIGAANASKSQYVTSKGLLETNLAINSALGTSVKLTDANAQEFTKLRVTAGLTNEELMGIQSLTITNGKSLEQNTGEIMAQAKFTGLKNGVLLNEKDILKGIKDVSSATTLTLGKNPKLIAEAVATAKSLGMEMSQIENISNSLLDFQSSIENELSAELLTGKQLNLETARYAALTGDVATVASEVAAQLGTAAEFGEMNRLQQDAIAKSVGMNREELAKTLYVQEQLKGVSGDQAKAQEALINKRIEEVGLAQAQQELAEKGVEGLEEQAGVATQFNAIVEKLQENFVFVADAVLPIFDMIAGIAGFLAKWPFFIGAIVGGMLALKAVTAAIAIKEITISIAKLFGENAKFGPLGLGLAVAGTAALGGAIAAYAADDLFSPGQGGSGYGKRTLLAPEGAYKLNDNDNIIATTNPVNVNDMISGPKGSIRPQGQTTQSQPTKSEISIAPGNTQINLNLNGAAIGNANARQDYGVGRGAKAFGGAVDYSAPI